MKLFLCEQCEHVVKHEVTLKGISRTKEGILLPSFRHTKHFCSALCFWKWVLENKPTGITIAGSEA